MKRYLVPLAIALAAVGAQAQVGTAAKEPGKATVERVEEAGQATAGAVTSGPKSQVHKAKAQGHKVKARQHAANARRAAHKAAQ